MLTRCGLVLALALVACEEEQTNARGESSDGDTHDTATTDNESSSPADDLTCDTLDFTACGGSVVGTWDLAMVCPETLEIPFSEAFADFQCFGDAACDDAAITITVTGVDGTTTFTANTYTASGTGTGDLDSTMSEACYDSFIACLGPFVLPSWDTFAEFCTALEDYMDDGAPEYGYEVTEATACAVNGTSCDCSGGGEKDLADSGTYETSGTTITLTNDEGAWEGAYCVDGDTAIVKPTVDPGDPELFEVYTK